MGSRERLSPADAAWLHMDRPTNLMVINAVTWFDEPLDWNRVREIVDERMVRPFPRFRQRISESLLPFDVPYWEDDPNFALDHHLHHVALPGPGDQETLQNFVGDLMSMPLDRAKPLWDFYFVDGYGKGCATVFRIHHSIGDGIALGQVLLSLTDPIDRSPTDPIDAPGAAAPPAPERRPAGLTSRLTGMLGPLAWSATTSLHAVDALAHEGLQTLRHPTRLRDIATLGRDDVAALARLTLTPPDSRTVLRGPGVVSKRAVWGAPYPLTDVKAIGRPMRATVNDVMLAAVTGALGRYLRERDSLVDNVRTFVPFNVRPSDQAPPPTLGNKFGLIFLDLPVGLDDPRERIATVSRRMAAVKNSPQGPISFGMLRGVGLTPTTVEKRIIDYFTARATAVMTNVPGPTQAVSFAGVPVRGVVSWVPRSGDTPIGLAIFSYKGRVQVGLAVDAQLVPEPASILAAMHEELDLMRQLVMATPAKKRTKAAAGG
ncbi:MAG: wax ester/triacylglycerol synthase family O-acyltransferase [Frankiaceae bacterium]